MVLSSRLAGRERFEILRSNKQWLASKVMCYVNFGFAAGCEAVALPRRQQPDIPGLCPWSGLDPSDLLGQRPHSGHSPKIYKGHLYGGKATASHPAAKPKPTNAGLLGQSLSNYK